MRHYFKAAVAAVCIACTCGCNLVGFMAAPTPHEKQVPAEYNLRNTESKVMVYVGEARIGQIPLDLRLRVDEMVRASLIRKVRIKEQYVLGPLEYATLRFAKSAVEIGREAGADLVVYVWIESFDLHQLHSAGYFKGGIMTRSVLLDTASGQVVWPKGADAKPAKLDFEIQTRGREAAIARLAAGVGHCVTRYFYNCPGTEFRWGDEQRDFDKVYGND